VFAFRARTNHLAFPVRDKLIHNDLTTIVAAFKYFGERATGPSGGTTVTGLNAFGIEVDADVVQRPAQIQVFFHNT
jgi:hypothetical protein